MSEFQPRSKLRSFLRAAIIVISLLFILGVVTGYGYLKNIERRLHSNRGVREAEKVISEPVGDEPINILILGSDARSAKENARSDTIIILRINPLNKRVYFVSIPRDTRVTVPGYGWDKINAANAYGGPQLAIKTVEAFTGFTIHHYVEVHFEGFKKMVDKLGGIVIDVEKPLVDRATKFGIPAGRQLMHGDRALDYVRFRKDAQGDFGRIERQQKFFQALLQKSLSLRSVFKLHGLISILADNAETDMTTGEMLSLANLLKSVDRSKVHMVTLPGEVKRIEGRSFVVPQKEVIEKILEAVKKEEPAKLAALKGETVVLRSSVRVTVLNGCGTANIAKIVAERLTEEGFKVVATSNAASFDYSRTVIRYRKGRYQAAEDVRGLFAGSIIEVLPQGEEGSSDVAVIVGKDSESAYRSGHSPRM